MKRCLATIMVLFLNEVFVFSCSSGGSSMRHSPKVTSLTKDSIYLSRMVFALPGSLYIPANVKSNRAPGRKNDTVLLQPVQNGHAQPNISSITVPLGAMYQATLPDSAVASLNAGTILSFADTASHNLYLQGEGFFETNKTTGTLQITADSVTIQASAGSSVNVFNFHNEPGIAISLLKGNITVKEGNLSVNCNTPGTLITFNRQTRQFKKQSCDTEQIAAWTQGRFYYPHIDLYSLLHRLGRWYNKEIIVKDSVPAGDYHISLWNYMALKDVLPILEHIADIRCEVKNDSLIISPVLFPEGYDKRSTP